MEQLSQLADVNSNPPGEPTLTLLPSQYTTQKTPGCDTPPASQHVVRKGGFGCDGSADQLKNVCGGHHDGSSPASQQELEQGSQLSEYAYVEDADDSESEQNGGSQHSANLDNLPPADHDLHE